MTPRLPCFGWRSAKCQLTGNLRLQTKRQHTESIQAYLFSPLLEAKLDRCSKLCATTLSLLQGRQSIKEGGQLRSPQFLTE